MFRVKTNVKKQEESLDVIRKQSDELVNNSVPIRKISNTTEKSLTRLDMRNSKKKSKSNIIFQNRNTNLVEHNFIQEIKENGSNEQSEGVFTRSRSKRISPKRKVLSLCFQKQQIRAD